MDEHDLNVEWFGHSCFKFTVKNKIYFFDPIRENKMLLTTLKPEKESKPDFIFVSHEHWDHYNARTTLALYSRQTKIYCPIQVAEPLIYEMSFEASHQNEFRKLIERIAPVKQGDIIKSDDVQIKCLAASEGLSFMIVHKGKKVLFMGDSVATPEMIMEKPDIILFPIWAVKGEEAKLEEFLELARERLCIPMHYHTSKDSLPNFYATIEEIKEILPKNINLKILIKNKIYNF